MASPSYTSSRLSGVSQSIWRLALQMFKRSCSLLTAATSEDPDLSSSLVLLRSMDDMRYFGTSFTSVGNECRFLLVGRVGVGVGDGVESITLHVLSTRGQFVGISSRSLWEQLKL